MLELKHISYAVREGDSELGILNDISLTIDDHRLVVFTGPNGGGKTTLAKIIMGLVKPTGGQILWNGQDITDLGITERARLGISYGFQQPPRFKGLTVRNLLTIASGNEKLSKDQCCQYLTKVERIISLADEIIVVGDGELRHRGTPEEILPQILADTLSGCPVLTKEGAAV